MLSEGTEQLKRHIFFKGKKEECIKLSMVKLRHLMFCITVQLLGVARGKWNSNHWKHWTTGFVRSLQKQICISNIRWWMLYVHQKSCHRRKIKLIDGNAKCHLKKFTWKGTLRRVFTCMRPRTLTPPPLTHCVRVNSVLIHTWKRGEAGVRVEPERRLEWQ